MQITRRFTNAKQGGFGGIEWVQRSSRILNPDGSVVFEMNDAEVPASWSQLATDIMVSKYFRKAGVPQVDDKGKVLKDEDGKVVTGPERSAKQVIGRLVGCWRHWGETHGYFDTAADAQTFYDELCYMMATQMAAPNSPQWFNTGLNWAYDINGPAQGHWYTDPATGETKLAEDAYTHPQPHACFIQSIEDDLVNDGGIMDLWVREARLFKYGSGTGTNFSRIRGEEERLSGGGRSSGLMSFLKIGDRAAGAIKSGGTTRRAAKMVCLDLDHPDVEGFVNWKVREEIKVAAMVEGLKHIANQKTSPTDTETVGETAARLGLKLDYDFNGESYQTVSGQNSNNSVRIPHEFFKRVDAGEDWELRSRVSGKVTKTLQARDLWDQISYAAWRCADPGVQYDGTINEWHTCPASGRINASNPCVTGDTLVSTSTGYRRIADLVGQTVEIVNGDGERAWVDRVFRTGHKPVYELKTRSGYQLKLTADHRVKTVNRGDVPACKLTTDDVLLLERTGFGDEWLPEDVAKQLGRALATGGHLGVSSTSSELDRAIFRARYRFSKGEHETLRLTDEFFTLCESSLANVLAGLMGESEAEIANLSDGLAQQVQLILLSFGVRSSIRKGIAGWEAHNGCRRDYQLWTVELHGSLTRRLVGASFADSAWCDDEADIRTLTDKFESLTPCGSEDVFDLTEPRSHHFVANGVVVHNCSEYMFLDNTACNLASLNLLKFYDATKRSFDIEGFEHGIDLWTMVLEISVLMAAFPSKEIARLSYEFRTLGLGYANIGAMLMQAGIPYDSEQSRAICGAITSVLTGRSYAMSAKMAAEHGAFPGYHKNREHMLRVVRNHRRAAYGVSRDTDAASQSELGNYEGLVIKPVPINGGLLQEASTGTYGQLSNAADLLHHARATWDEALREGEEHGYRNAQTTVIAPTGTIGLLMDCDTTGVEPDFALVKFKKLAGGGYFKIANQSLRPALESLGYSKADIRDIMAHVMGRQTVEVPVPGGKGTFGELLKSKGLIDADLKKISDGLGGAMDLGFVINAWTLGGDAIERLGFADKSQQPGFNLLRELGLSRKQIDQLNDVICGTGTVEGAPHLKQDHYAVFDCANKCGKTGQRFIEVEGHIRMMAAAQPFISGAISKTINLPNEATLEDIKAAYRLSWELGLKANALYRDGCKLSQPLNSKTDADVEADDEENVEAGKSEVSAAVAQAASQIAAVATEQRVRIVEKLVERIVERPMRRRLPDTRASKTHKFNVAGHEGYITVGLYDDGTPGELFITMAKEGSTIGGLMDSLGTAISIALQYGVPTESLVNKFTHQRFEPAGMTHNKDIPFAKSLVDYIFRWMGMEFVAGYRAANAPHRPGDDKPLKKPADDVLPSAAKARAVATPKAKDDGDCDCDEHSCDETGNGGDRRIAESPLSSVSARGEQVRAANGDGDGGGQSVMTEAMKNMQADAPACDVCGTITVRNGTCYKCLNCGNSMGCS